MQWSLRLLRLVLLAAVGVAALYLMAANAFLSLGGVAKMFEATDDINATYRLAWTYWPGQIHVRDLRITFQDHNVQWSLDLPRGRVRLRLPELLERTFHATEVRGDGAVFRMRHRVHPEQAHLPDVAALPPMPEFETPAVFEAFVPEPPVPEEEYDYWIAHIEDVDVGVAEVWAQQFRYIGAGRARGSFRLRPDRTLWVEPASLDLDSGQLFAGTRPAASSLSGRIECIVHFFDVNAPVGREVFRHISSKIRLTAREMNLNWVELFLNPAHKISIDSGSGTLTVTANVRRGVLDSGSLLLLESPHFALAHPNFGLRLHSPVARLTAKPDGKGELVFALASAELDRPERQGASPRARALSISAQSSSLDTAAEWELTEARVHAPLLEVPDLRWLGGDLPRAIAVEGGRLSAALLAHHSDGRWQGEGLARVNGLRARGGQLLVESELEAQGRFASAADGSSRGELHAELRKLALQLDKLGLKVAAPDALVTGSVQRLVSGAVRTEFAVSAPRVSLRAQGATAELRKLGASSQLWRSKSGRLDGWLESSAEHIVATAGAVMAQARVRMRVEAMGLDADAHRGKLQGQATLSDFVLNERGSRPECATVTFPTASMLGELVLGADRHERVTLAAEAEQLSVRWGDFRARARAVLGAELERAAEGEGSALQRVALSVQARDADLRSAAGDTQGWHARVGALTASARLRAQGTSFAGSLDFKAEDAHGRIGRTPVSTHLDAAVRVAALDPARREARGSASVRVRDGALRTDGFDIAGWWADVELDAATVSARDNLDLSSVFRAKLRDGMPALSVLASEGELPGWVPEFLPLRQLEASGLVLRRCQVTELRVLESTGGPLQARGRFFTTPDQTRAAFLVRLRTFSPLAAGFSVGAGDDGTTLLAGEDWLSERLLELDGRASEVLSHPCPEPPSECSP